MRRLLPLLLILVLVLACIPAGAETVFPWGTPEEAAALYTTLYKLLGREDIEQKEA